MLFSVGHHHRHACPLEGRRCQLFAIWKNVRHGGGRLIAMNMRFILFVHQRDLGYQLTF
jgi:hypothetical protein